MRNQTTDRGEELKDDVDRQTERETGLKQKEGNLLFNWTKKEIKVKNMKEHNKKKINLQQDFTRMFLITENIF